VIRIFDIAQKDLLQMVRDGKVFMFLLIMPVVFTFLFGYAFGGFGESQTDSRLPVGYLDQDQSWLSEQLYDLLAASEVIRLDWDPARAVSDLEQLVADEELAAAIVIPNGYGKATVSGKRARLTLIADTAAPTGTTVQAEILATVNRLDSAASTAIAIEETVGNRVPFDYAFEQALSAWEEPPIAVVETTSSAIQWLDSRASLAHTSPGMILQFAIAGLLTAAQIIVTERKSRALQRLLTTATRRVHILVGHYMAIFIPSSLSSLSCSFSLDGWCSNWITCARSVQRCW